MDEQEKIVVECAHCGNTQLRQIPGVWTPMPLNEKGLFQGPAVPVVMLGCPRCGYVQMFSANMIRPIPFPHPPATDEQKDQ